MELEIIDSESSFHPGHGAGSGEVIRKEYKCPCGKGIVLYEKDAIPGFRDKSTSCDCADCNNKYDFNRNIAIEK